MTRLPGEQRTNPVNIAKFAISHPRSVVTLARKVIKRVADQKGSHSQAETVDWLARNATDPAAIAEELAPDLWVEAIQFGRELRDRAEPILAAVPYDLGAGGDYEFMYWLTRFRRPEVVVETGVSAGWTSQAFLSALERNGGGRLYSSDFPFFRIRDPESVIGCLVEDRLRSGWSLHVEGDEVNLPRILSGVDRVDLFNYDSDKSYSGRAFAVDLVRSKLASDGLITMDDISNNSYFHDEATRGGAPFSVLGGTGRFGVIGDIAGSP